MSQRQKSVSKIKQLLEEAKSLSAEIPDDILFESLQEMDANFNNLIGTKLSINAMEESQNCTNNPVHSTSQHHSHAHNRDEDPEESECEDEEIQELLQKYFPGFSTDLPQDVGKENLSDSHANQPSEKSCAPSKETSYMMGGARRVLRKDKKLKSKTILRDEVPLKKPIKIKIPTSSAKQTMSLGDEDGRLTAYSDGKKLIRSDPVAMYQSMQKTWKKMPLLGSTRNPLTPIENKKKLVHRRGKSKITKRECLSCAETKIDCRSHGCKVVDCLASSPKKGRRKLGLHC